ncbi:MAG TPA: hypothetical protein VM118_09585, partial [Acidobacteriota bacterium]|nr:hypothetical protein [Acidobacteriota bacterium]
MPANAPSRRQRRRRILSPCSLNIVLSLVVVLSACTSARADGISYSDGNLVYGSVQIEWADTVPTPLKTAVEQRAHKTFQGTVDQRRFGDATRSLLELLADEGYHRAAAAPRDFTVNGDALEFGLVVDPGPPLLIGGWRFTGLTRTDTTWLASALDLPIGVVWTRALADRISRRLHSFSHVAAAGSPQLEPGPTDSSVFVVIPLTEQNPATIDGMLAASSVDGTSASRQLTGRLTVGLSGLFRRDRSVRLRYEKPHRTETLFRLNLREAGAFGRRLDWQLGVEEWDRLDHRQTVDVAVGHGVGERDFRIEWRGRLVR